MTLHAHFGFCSLLFLRITESSSAAALASCASLRSLAACDSRSSTLRFRSSLFLVASFLAYSSLRAFSSASRSCSRNIFSRWMASRACFCNVSTWPLSRPTSRSCSSCASPRRPAASAAAALEASSSVASRSSAFSASMEPSHRMRAMRETLRASRTVRAAGLEGRPLSMSSARASDLGSAVPAVVSCVSQATQSALAAFSRSSAMRSFCCSRARSSGARPSFSSLQCSRRTAGSPTERERHSSRRALRPSFVAAASSASRTGNGRPPGTGSGSPWRARWNWAMAPARSSSARAMHAVCCTWSQALATFSVLLLFRASTSPLSNPTRPAAPSG
mmetsp:Transcript_10707/g.31402  ORF Transcript_10707/g.31402 Transcript_10707/m.31402 type:complete len:333 (+) Transcript_10707:126-1124(+)